MSRAPHWRKSHVDELSLEERGVLNVLELPQSLQETARLKHCKLETFREEIQKALLSLISHQKEAKLEKLETSTEEKKDVEQLDIHVSTSVIEPEISRLVSFDQELEFNKKMLHTFLFVNQEDVRSIVCPDSDEFLGNSKLFKLHPDLSLSSRSYLELVRLIHFEEYLFEILQIIKPRKAATVFKNFSENNRLDIHSSKILTKIFFTFLNTNLDMGTLSILIKSQDLHNWANSNPDRCSVLSHLILFLTNLATTPISAEVVPSKQILEILDEVTHLLSTLTNVWRNLGLASFFLEEEQTLETKELLKVATNFRVFIENQEGTYQANEKAAMTFKKLARLCSEFEGLLSGQHQIDTSPALSEFPDHTDEAKDELDRTSTHSDHQEQAVGLEEQYLKFLLSSNVEEQKSGYSDLMESMVKSNSFLQTKGISAFLSKHNKLISDDDVWLDLMQGLLKLRTSIIKGDPVEKVEAFLELQEVLFESFSEMSLSKQNKLRSKCLSYRENLGEIHADDFFDYDSLVQEFASFLHPKPTSLRSLITVIFNQLTSVDDSIDDDEAFAGTASCLALRFPGKFIDKVLQDATTNRGQATLLCELLLKFELESVIVPPFDCETYSEPLLLRKILSFIRSKTFDDQTLANFLNFTKRLFHEPPRTATQLIHNSGVDSHESERSRLSIDLKLYIDDCVLRLLKSTATKYQILASLGMLRQIFEASFGDLQKYRNWGVASYLHYSNLVPSKDLICVCDSTPFIWTCMIPSLICNLSGLLDNRSTNTVIEPKVANEIIEMLNLCINLSICGILYVRNMEVSDPLYGSVCMSLTKKLLTIREKTIPYGWEVQLYLSPLTRLISDLDPSNHLRIVDNFLLCDRQHFQKTQMKDIWDRVKQQNDRSSDLSENSGARQEYIMLSLFFRSLFRFGRISDCHTHAASQGYLQDFNAEGGSAFVLSSEDSSKLWEMVWSEQYYVALVSALLNVLCESSSNEFLRITVDILPAILKLDDLRDCVQHTIITLTKVIKVMITTFPHSPMYKSRFSHTLQYVVASFESLERHHESSQCFSTLLFSSCCALIKDLETNQLNSQAVSILAMKLLKSITSVESSQTMTMKHYKECEVREMLSVTGGIHQQVAEDKNISSSSTLDTDVGVETSSPNPWCLGCLLVDVKRVPEPIASTFLNHLQPFIDGKQKGVEAQDSEDEQKQERSQEPNQLQEKLQIQPEQSTG